MSHERYYTPEDEAQIMIDSSEEIALRTLKEMDDEECLSMVRDFCSTMANWQPEIAACRDDPMALGANCLAVAHLFKLAFAKAYVNTSARLTAQEAIRKAFNS